jgi:hypothetical protein
MAILARESGLALIPVANISVESFTTLLAIPSQRIQVKVAL